MRCTRVRSNMRVSDARVYVPTCACPMHACTFQHARVRCTRVYSNMRVSDECAHYNMRVSDDEYVTIRIGMHTIRLREMYNVEI